ncbi:Imm49 family immunity protein [Algibacillus agarilyticus]|uniref:Imm49 family immunity protein n=1 Tax=Algibacillus agarilyticus TaxID=2234133 RepID=UPI000DD07E3D|nr:Imm49 family immunity protein [Algibacillus agarilyticus]
MQHFRESHPNKDWIVECNSGRIERVFSKESLRQRYPKELPGRVFSDGSDFFEVAAAAWVAEKPKDVILDWLTQAHTAKQAHFYLVLNPGEEFNFVIRDIPVKAVGQKRLSYSGVHCWEEAFYLALILDDEAAFNNLRQYQSQDFLDPRAEDLAIGHAFSEFAKGLFNPDANINALVQEIATLSDPKYIPPRRQGFIYSVWLPFVDVMLAVLAKNEAKFQTRMDKALNAHHQFFSDKTKCDGALGWLSMPMTAAACLAYSQHGFIQNQTNPYVPSWLVK